MRKIFIVIFALLTTMSVSAQDYPKGPELEYVCELKVKLGQSFSVGQTSHGERVVIPIIGGTFEGPNVKGEVLNGGADYQLVDKEKGRNEIEAIYCIRTDDGVNIHVRNCGIIYTSRNADGTPNFYFRTSPKFEAPSDSKYDWLNNATFVCMPSGFEAEHIRLRVWKVL